MYVHVCMYACTVHVCTCIYMYVCMYHVCIVYNVYCILLYVVLLIEIKKAVCRLLVSVCITYVHVINF